MLETTKTCVRVEGRRRGRGGMRPVDGKMRRRSREWEFGNSVPSRIVRPKGALHHGSMGKYFWLTAYNKVDTLQEFLSQECVKSVA